MSLNHFVGYVNMHEYKRIVQFYEHQLNGILINNLKLNRNPFKILYSKCFPFSHPSTKKKALVRNIMFSFPSTAFLCMLLLLFFFRAAHVTHFPFIHPHHIQITIYNSICLTFLCIQLFFRCCSVSRMLFFCTLVHLAWSEN